MIAHIYYNKRVWSEHLNSVHLISPEVIPRNQSVSSCFLEGQTDGPSMVRRQLIDDVTDADCWVLRLGCWWELGQHHQHHHHHHHHQQHCREESKPISHVPRWCLRAPLGTQLVTKVFDYSADSDPHSSPHSAARTPLLCRLYLSTNLCQICVQSVWVNSAWRMSPADLVVPVREFFVVYLFQWTMKWVCR